MENKDEDIAQSLSFEKILKKYPNKYKAVIEISKKIKEKLGGSGEIESTKIIKLLGELLKEEKKDEDSSGNNR